METTITLTDVWGLRQQAERARLYTIPFLTFMKQFFIAFVSYLMAFPFLPIYCVLVACFP